MNDKQENEEARGILDRVSRDSETIASSSMGRAASEVRNAVSGRDGTAEDDDPIEVLGKRIGRTLGIVAVIALMIYLFNTYMLQ